MMKSSRPASALIGLLSAAVFGRAAIAAPVTPAPQSLSQFQSVLNSAAGIQQFALDKKAQARCAHGTLKSYRAALQDRPVDFDRWEKACPAFALPLQTISSFPTAIQKAALLGMAEEIGRATNSCVYVNNGFGAIC